MAFSQLTFFVLVLAHAIHNTHAYGVSSSSSSRRSFFSHTGSVLSVLAGSSVAAPRQAVASSFTPGGTLVDRDVGVTVSNSQASSSRLLDNSNVIFTQDYYFKFGTAAPWIDESNVQTFPAQMPFVPSQQRYNAMIKYGDRVRRGMETIAALQAKYGDASVPGPESPDYAIRAMGLLANNFCASENIGTTNEVLLARWYVNEIYLGIGDMRAATSADKASQAYRSTIKAANSYLNMINRVITPKVGDKFDLIKL